VLYVADECPHCFEQQQMFGSEASAELKVVECAPDGFQNQVALCRLRQLVGYPSLEIDGQVDVGVKSLRRLSGLSRFPNGAAF
jgi:Zn ribbon nucleic-acid-binding protein